MDTISLQNNYFTHDDKILSTKMQKVRGIY